MDKPGPRRVLLIGMALLCSICLLVHQLVISSFSRAAAGATPGIVAALTIAAGGFVLLYILGLLRENASLRFTVKRYSHRLRESQVRARELNASLLAGRAQAQLLSKDLELAKTAVETANRTKTEFLARMSHQIRTPMTSILGFSETLEESELSAEERVSALRTIRRNGQHLIALINDILDLAKIETGRFALEPANCDPLAIAHDAVELVRGNAERMTLPIELRCESALPVRITTDPARLRQVLINLLSNAVKFTTRGAVSIELRLLDPPDSTCPQMSFTVRDTGLGMNSGQIGKLFQPFGDVEADAGRPLGGTGLGLTISRRLAWMLGGDIEVRSDVGVGSVFTLTIDTGMLLNVPLRQPTQGSKVAETAAPVAFEPLAGRVLLAEDGPDNQRLITHVLKRFGLDVAVVENGRLAVERALADQGAGMPFDVILMDMQMPELDGYGATRALRDAGYFAPIIALTANALPGDRERCLEAGCDEFLTKPVDRAELHLVLSRELARAQQVAADSSPL
ncbi:MAG: response regulator [Planctomycetes bacterium]|nr:response regulator [Planctomycetota bacterium]